MRRQGLSSRMDWTVRERNVMTPWTVAFANATHEYFRQLR